MSSLDIGRSNWKWKNCCMFCCYFIIKRHLVFLFFRLFGKCYNWKLQRVILTFFPNRLVYVNESVYMDYTDCDKGIQLSLVIHVLVNVVEVIVLKL